VESLGAKFCLVQGPNGGQPSVQCPVFLTNLEGKVGKVGKVAKVRKVGCVSSNCQSSTRFYSSLTKMVKK
jgi:hypothetical protein